MFKNLLIRLGLLSEPSLDKALPTFMKGVSKLEAVIDFHKVKSAAAAEVARLKQLEAEVSAKAHQDTTVVLNNFKKLLNLA